MKSTILEKVLFAVFAFGVCSICGLMAAVVVAVQWDIQPLKHSLGL